jgi:hypothetical protein
MIFVYHIPRFANGGHVKPIALCKSRRGPIARRKKPAHNDITMSPLKTYIPISKCRICKHLGEEEYGFQKYGWPDDDVFLKGTISELKDVSKSKGFKSCPECGTFYSYREQHEYLVEGSEEEQILIRISPTEAKEYFSKSDYERRISMFEKELTARSKKLREHAAKSLAYYYLFDSKEPKKAKAILASSDPVVQTGAFNYFYTLSEYYDSGKTLKPLRPLIKELIKSSDKKTAQWATWIQQRTRWKF